MIKTAMVLVLDVGYGHGREPNIADIRQYELGSTATVMGIVNSNNAIWRISHRIINAG